MKLIKKLKGMIARHTAREVTSFEKITLRLAGMRMTAEYEITDGEPAALSRFFIGYANGEDVRTLDRCVFCSRESIIALLNSCGVSGWNGFHGAHPRNVCDGTMFRISAVVNENETISAYGSENFPDGYREFIGGLDKLLADSADQSR